MVRHATSACPANVHRPNVAMATVATRLAVGTMAVSTRVALLAGMATALQLTAGCTHHTGAPAMGTIERHRFEIAATANEQIVAQPVTEG